MVGRIELRKPVSTDGYGVNQLVARCAPLDTNSIYCNLLQCDHFAQTSVIALELGNVVGFVSGYCIPERPDTLFVWQVAVDESQRGTGLATTMLRHILGRSELSEVTFLETTITPDNKGSWALFTRFSERVNAPLEKKEFYRSQPHFNGEHDTEWLLRIGPFLK